MRTYLAQVLPVQNELSIRINKQVKTEFIGRVLSYVSTPETYRVMSCYTNECIFSEVGLASAENEACKILAPIANHLDRHIYIVTINILTSP